MKQLKLILLLVGSLVPILLQAQAPGYLGKKATIGLQTSTFPVITGPSQNNKGSDFFGDTGGGFGMNFEWELQFSYVTGRYQQLTLTAGQYYTGVNAYLRTPSPFTSPFSSVVDIDLHYLLMRLNVRSLGIRHHYFKAKKGSLAPFGNHFFYGLKYSFVRGDILDKNTFYGNLTGRSREEHAPLPVHQRHAIGTFLMGWSNDQLYWDRIIFSYGFRIGLTLAFKTFTSEDTGDNRSYEDVVGERLLRHESFRIDIGVKYLLF